METFVTFMFWATLFGWVVKLLCICGATYPRQTRVREDMVSAIFTIPIILWAAYLLFV